MRVLLSAFGFSPYHGSESAVGWNIARELAKIHDVTVITGSVREGEDNWEKYRRENGDVRGLTVVQVRPTWLMKVIDKFHQLPGLWALYYVAYNLWQKAAFKRAKELHTTHPFDIVHQLTMIGYREPGYMWKLDAPFVWGPIGGAPNEPWRYLRLFSLAGSIGVGLRTICNEIQKRMCFRAMRAAKRAKRLWAVTDADAEMIRSIWRCQCDRIIEAGADGAISGNVHKYLRGQTLRIVWSGVHEPRKALPILLQALARLPDKRLVRVDILGEGPETKKWKRLASQLNLGEMLTWHGTLRRAEALKVMDLAHVLACPSVKEASSIVVIEALALGLPVICHDACGMGVVVTERCGFKMPLKNPASSVDGFLGAIEMILENPGVIEEKSVVALSRARELSWAAKARQFSSAYFEIRKTNVHEERRG